MHGTLTCVCHNLLGCPLNDTGLGRQKKNLSWPFHGFQPRTLGRLVFAVSLKFLIATDFLRIPHPTSIGKSHEVFVLAREGMCQCDIAATVSGAQKTLVPSSWGKLPLLVWNHGSQQELLERPKPAKNAQSSEWSVNTASIVPMPSLRGLGICMECVLAVIWFTTDYSQEATMLARSWGSPCGPSQ